MIDLRVAAAVAMVALAASASAGCMRIYPDPELPDIVVEWSETCEDDGVTVRVEVVADDGTVTTQDFPCSEHKGRIEDLDRVKHTVSAALLDAGQVVLGRTMPSPVDLRPGLSRRAFLFEFMRDQGFVKVAWTFAGDDTCGGLGTEAVDIAFASDELGSSIGAECGPGTLEWLPSLMAGTYTMQLRAVRSSDFAAVAVSETRTGVIIPDRGAVVDLGTIQLTRCVGPCPPAPMPPPPPDEPPDPDPSPSPSE